MTRSTVKICNPYGGPTEIDNRQIAAIRNYRMSLDTATDSFWQVNHPMAGHLWRLNSDLIRTSLGSIPREHRLTFDTEPDVVEVNRLRTSDQAI